MQTPAVQFQLEVSQLRSYLLKFAQLQLRDTHLAEDVVSETIVAALSKPQAFAGLSQLKTYLVGILKFKIIDQFRNNKGLISLTPDDDGDGSAELEALLFGRDGHFETPPGTWGDPEGLLQTRQFFEVLEMCLAHLPPQMAKVFMMREWLEMSSTDICKETQLSTTNLHVSLHRARLRLRECLELKWFSLNKD
jgi:RNA polymerase sigma-70 factor (TIGR02943 family)